MRKVGKIDSRGRDRVTTINKDPSMTVQSDAHLADINTIMRDFHAGGIDLLDEADLQFKDVSEFTDLADALNQARVAEVEFMRLPSKVREIFQHDVAVWLDTAHDEDKRNELVAAGFIKSESVDSVVAEATTEGEAPGASGETETDPGGAGGGGSERGEAVT